MDWKKVSVTAFVVVILSIGMTIIPNKSNFPTVYVVPIIVALLTKYILGDWDKGYTWTRSDIWYWSFIFAVSYATIFVMGIQKVII
jgi:hypothetical protein